ncbi:putative 1-phosphatidylinositol-4-phosphate 5-kinase [Helianthus annuus]|nr:putative 1-phosphatidylinositol-4-phosphate 5-kinase [Helianthus annuus]
MHQKKSDIQIGTDSTGISSDFNPTPTIPHQSPQNLSLFKSTCSSSSSLCSSSSLLTIQSLDHLHEHQIVIDDDHHSVTRSTPHKRSVFSQTNSVCNNPFTSKTVNSNRFRFCNPKFTLIYWVNRLSRLRRLRTHLRLILLLSVPVFYFVVSNPTRSLVLDFLSALAFSAALLLSLNLALPRLPSIRLFFARSFPIKLTLSENVSFSRSALPVLWSIGSRAKMDYGYDSGCWVQTYNNGDVYEGEFHKGRCSGCGVYYYCMSGRYEGDWVDGKYDGYGVETWARGSRYRGQYRVGLRHGFGVYRFYTGDVYAGEWLNGQSHGCGVHTCEDGSWYVGEFKQGSKHGLGHYHFRNGDTYAGEYFADKLHGFGVYSFANGHRYEGSWHEGRRQGLGMYTFKNGETHSGHWHNGVLDIPSSHSATQPVSPVGVYHSRVLNAIQEARRAAERAYDVTKVDERVNRAVAAANRSANAARVAAVKAVQKQPPDKSNCHKLHNIYHSQTNCFQQPSL